MRLKVKEESGTGLNIKFINQDTGATIGLNQAITQIRKGNPAYKNYEAVSMATGTEYIRSKPDKSTRNNIEG